MDVGVIGTGRALACGGQRFRLFVSALADEKLGPPRFHTGGNRCLVSFHEYPVAGRKLSFCKLRHAEMHISFERIEAARHHQ